MYNADEAFVTGTFSGIIPVVEIDGHKFNIGPLQKGYLLFIKKILKIYHKYE